MICFSVYPRVRSELVTEPEPEEAGVAMTEDGDVMTEAVVVAVLPILGLSTGCP